MAVHVNIQKCRNGYYIRVWRSFWQWNPDRLVADSEENVGVQIADYLNKKSIINKEAKT
jgi:hypothetical protein